MVIFVCVCVCLLSLSIKMYLKAKVVFIILDILTSFCLDVWLQ